MKKRLFFGSTVAFIASPPAPALAVDRFADSATSTIDLGETVLSSWSAQLGYRYEF